MASKNLGAVIQRAISDGAFRRQLQSDPAAALRGFNLTPDEVAAIRSGDSGKLMSLGVDQRMSKAFSVFGGTGASARSTLADGTASAGSSAVIDGGTASTSDALTLGNTTGARALHEEAPSDSGIMLNDPTTAQTRAINDNAPWEGSVSASADGASATRSVRESEPFVGNATANDNLAAAEAGRGGSLAGDMSVGSRMADANAADATRALHNVEPSDLGSSQVAATNDFIGGEIQHDARDVTGTPGNALSDTTCHTPRPHAATR